MAHRISWFHASVITAAALAVGACGSDSASAPVPAAEALGASLVAADDFDGTWAVNAPPDATDIAESGVVPDEFQDSLPTIDLCDNASAESLAAAEALRWKAFRQLDLTVEDPIEPPGDRSGHMIFVQEFLTSAEPGEVEATFDLLREGMEACLGDLPAGEEGPGTAEEMTVPEVGDDRYGVLMLVEEAGGWAEWRLHSTLVRNGSVLMSFVVVEITAGVEPLYSIADVSGMLETAVDKLDT